MNLRQKEWKELIEDRRAEEVRHQTQLERLIRNCEHSIVKRNESAVCEVCESRVGWWCPKSPDHKCYYFSVHRETSGVTRRVVILLSGKEDESFLRNNSLEIERESYDSCLYCGEPNERK